MANLAKQGKMALKGTAGANQDLFSKDGVRPEPAGDRAYAGAILAALEGMKGEGPAVHALARPLASDSWERARQVAITPKMLSGEWKQSALEGPNQPRFARHFDTLTQTTIPGAKLTFRFKGTSAALFNLMGPATGRVRVTVDGKDRGIRQQVDPWSYYYRLAAIPLIDGLPDAEHTVVVELLPDAPDRGVPIAAARKANAYDEKAFEGVAMHLGWIRVMGEVVE